MSSSLVGWAVSVPFERGEGGGVASSLTAVCFSCAFANSLSSA
jgi:hypothetical protein